MKNIIFAILVYLITEFDNYSYSANFQNNIILKVENEIITSFEIKNKIISSLILSNQEISQENIDRLKSQALEALIQYKLKKIELSKHNFKNDTARVNAYLQKISSNNLELLKKEFNNYNLDYQLFLDEIQTQFKWQKLIYRIYSKKISFNEKSINNELQNLINNKKDIEEYQISEIEIPLSNNESDNIKISQIKEEIEKNGFETTALKYSISSSAANKGNIGWINVKSLSKNIYNQIAKIKIGEVTDPISKQGSILILKLNNKRISKSENFDIEELKKNLISQKKNELFNLYSRSHLSKIRNNSYIEYYR